MAILEGDIKLLASERLTDTTDGGGRKTGSEIVTGQHNAVFPDISDLDRAYGRVNLRKMFLGVETPDNDVYFGAHVIVLTPPADPSVSITLFSTDDHFDERSSAQNYIESYLAKGPKWQGYLYDTQLKGQRAIRLIQRAAVRLPEVGETLVMVGKPGAVDEYFEYVRITDVKSVATTFLVEGYSQEFVRNVVTCELSAPLTYSFEGNQPTPYDNAAQVSQLRETVVADAAKYYSTVPLSRAAAFGAMQLYADCIYTQLVPSSRTETPAVDLTAGGQVSTLSPSSNGVVSFITTVAVSSGKALYLGTGAEPGSVSLTVGAAVIKDSGGELLLGGTVVGAIDYQRGALTFNSQCPNYGTTSKTAAFKPASAVTRIVDTQHLPVTESTRGYAYTATLKPIPAPGTLTLSFMAQGKWYDLTDNGKGQLVGADASYGSGMVNFTTGSLMVTLGALPDTGSEILMSWGSPTTSFNRADLSTALVGVSGVLGSTIEFNAPVVSMLISS